ncbi:hypothetical protein [Nostoc sp. ChiQUE01b]|uniref:hypothetical protein n=1 Tax=Nostoc sp. ChiQUE01b TaxID=3075376 RepID=UPI002AD440B4|nr:hypothetical protein [Nostoc sp. ChiQUE01b]
MCSHHYFTECDHPSAVGETYPLTSPSVDRKVFQKPYQSLIYAWKYNPTKSASNLPFKNFCSGWTSERCLLYETLCERRQATN